jgi:hypothetical protein
MNKIEIEIPVGKEVDWELSAKQKQIVFKDKQLTYEDMCEELFAKEHYFMDDNGDIHLNKWVNKCPNNATTKHQLECILAKNKLANVARYLNGEWRPASGDTWYWLSVNTNNSVIVDSWPKTYSFDTGKIYFKSSKLAKQAIEILGEEIVKLALEPLY